MARGPRFSPHRDGLIPGFEIFSQNLESLSPLPKDHSQSAQDLVKNSTLNPGTGGSNEKAVSRKRSAGRVGVSGAGSIRCRTAGAIYTAAAAGSGLHLDRLLCRCERRYFIRNEHPQHGWQFRHYRRPTGGPRAAPGRGRGQHCRLLQPLRLHRRLPRRLQLSGRRVGLGRRSRRLPDQQRGSGAGSATRDFPGRRQAKLGFPNAGALARDRARQARVGGVLGWDKSMIYVTGGGAWAKIDTSEFLLGTFIGTGHQESNTRSGWTVGGGIEYALGYGWSVNGEYLYVDFDHYTTFTSPPFGIGNISPRDVKLNDHIFRGGLNYRFW